MIGQEKAKSLHLFPFSSQSSSPFQEGLLTVVTRGRKQCGGIRKRHKETLCLQEWLNTKPHQIVCFKYVVYVKYISVFKRVSV